MKFNIFLNCIGLVILLNSCQHGSNKRGYVPSPDSTEQLPAKNIKTIIGVVDVSADTIVILKGDAIEMTLNHGKTWTTISTSRYINQLTIDDKGVFWGLYSWLGIHESSKGWMVKSSDFGKHWQGYDFNIKSFFPYYIMSSTGQPLKVMASDYKIFKLTGPDLKKDWTYSEKVNSPEDFIQENIYHKYAGEYRIDDSRVPGLKLLKVSKGRVDTLLHLSDVTSISSMMVIKDTLYIAGFVHSDKTKSEPYFASVSNERKLLRYKLYGGLPQVSKGTDGRVWIYNNRGLFLKTDTGLLKFH
ncbi:MAG: hypothetical protein ABIN91_05055 [Mucilaginibacter sp.]|uniref:hypothetical protein n=1 Tax=Mucilaginibacter sp. TaxID=1882438 RepID=UPI0032658DAA